MDHEVLEVNRAIRVTKYFRTSCTLLLSTDIRKIGLDFDQRQSFHNHIPVQARQVNHQQKQFLCWSSQFLVFLYFVTTTRHTKYNEGSSVTLLWIPLCSTCTSMKFQEYCGYAPSCPLRHNMCRAKLHLFLKTDYSQNSAVSWSVTLESQIKEGNQGLTLWIQSSRCSQGKKKPNRPNNTNKKPKHMTKNHNQN